jgi:hypothetical protein
VSYPETLAQSCVCASAGILQIGAADVPQASGEGIGGLPAHSTRSSLSTVVGSGFWFLGDSLCMYMHQGRWAGQYRLSFWSEFHRLFRLPPERSSRAYEIEWKRVQKDVDLHAELA